MATSINDPIKITSNWQEWFPEKSKFCEIEWIITIKPSEKTTSANIQKLWKAVVDASAAYASRNVPSAELGIYGLKYGYDKMQKLDKAFQDMWTDRAETIMTNALHETGIECQYQLKMME